MVKKITLSEVTKKHLKITAYLVLSSVLAYVVSVMTDTPEAIYLTPIINYILYAIKTELDEEGYMQILKK